MGKKKKSGGKGGAQSKLPLQPGHPSRAPQEGEEKEEKEEEEREVEVESRVPEMFKLAEAAGGAADPPSEEERGAGGGASPASSPPRGAEKGKGGGGGGEGVDVDGRGIDLAADMLRGVTMNEEGGAGSSEDSLVDIGVKLWVALVKSLPKEGPTAVSIGYGNGQKCKALGVKRESIQKANISALLDRTNRLEGTEIIAVMRELWDLEFREYQYVVLEMLVGTIIQLSREVGFEEVFEFLRYCVVTKSGRDTVDHLAKYLLNALAYLEPPETKPVMDVWIQQDQHPWLQRAALLHQACLGHYCDFDRLACYCSKFIRMTSDMTGFEEKWSAMRQALMAYGDTGLPEDDDSSLGVLTAKEKVIKFLGDQLKRGPSADMKQRLGDLKSEVEEKKKQFLKKKVRGGRAV